VSEFLRIAICVLTYSNIYVRHITAAISWCCSVLHAYMLGEGLFFERDLICSRAYSSSPIHKHHTGWHKQRAIRITLNNTRRSLETYRTTVLQIFLCMSKVILIWVTHVCAKLKSLRRSQGVLSYDIIGVFSSSPCLGFLT